MKSMILQFQTTRCFLCVRPLAPLDAIFLELSTSRSAGLAEWLNHFTRPELPEYVPISDTLGRHTVALYQGAQWAWVFLLNLGGKAA